MAIRLSGMNSGLDTDSIVKALVSGYTTKKEKYEKAQTKLGWKQESWKSLNTKVYSMYSNISNLRFSSAYNLKKDIGFRHDKGHSYSIINSSKWHAVA